MTTTTPTTTTCADWCTDPITEIGYGGPGVDSHTCRGPASTYTDRYDDAVQARLERFSVSHEPPGPVEVAIEGPNANLSPAQARAMAAALVELADAAEATA